MLTASSPLRLALVLLLALSIHGGAPAATTATDSSTSSSTTSQEDAPKLSSAIEADASTKLLQQRTSEFLSLQSKFDNKLSSVQNIRDVIKYELGTLDKLSLGGDQNAASSAPGLHKMYDDMDVIGTKAVELIRRTERVLGRVGEYNKMVLGGGESSANESAEAEDVVAAVGLEERLGKLLIEELDRRKRYHATMAEAGIAIGGSISEENAEEQAAIDSTESARENNATSSPPYITLTELEELLSPQKVITPSEKTLQGAFLALTNTLLGQQIATDEELLKKRSHDVPKQYEEQYNNIKRELDASAFNGRCLAIPRAVEIVAKVLKEHYHDGTNMIDHASYENGGAVVYELTSSSYVPPPRSDAFDSSLVGRENSERAMYQHDKQRAYDEQTEEVYYQQQRYMHNPDGGSSTSLFNQLSDAFEKFNLWEWYTAFKFEALRPYLPEDWERFLDHMSARIGKGLSWSDYTPRGAIDAVVPDYVYHGLGVSNDVKFGSWFGRTASPEVAISAGYSKSGGGGKGGGGYVAKAMGYCYPLSMRPEDDPALPLLSRNAIEGGGMEMMDDEDESLLIGPKYTVRLPYPIQIDAVTLEHRSFPLPRASLESGLMGGESAPRWIRVVGYPPCPAKEDVNAAASEEEEECGVRGFDITNPINLGSFEYQRITVTGRENDYGGSDEDEEEEGSDTKLDGRRRSIQTFAVKGGQWKEPSLFGHDSLENGGLDTIEEYDSRDPRQCAEDPSSCGAPVEEEEEELLVGQCMPPKDEESEPSCGGDETTSSLTGSSSSTERQVVEAVSFVIEENWGNSEYTCLYRVRVHGDAVIV